MEQKTRVVVDGGERSWSKRVAIEMGQSMRVLDAREGLALCEVPDIYLIKEMEARGLIQPKSLQDVMRSAYILAREQANGEPVRRLITDELIAAAVEVEGNKHRVRKSLGMHSHTILRAVEDRKCLTSSE